MRRALIPLAIGFALWFAAISAQAVGFGRASSPTVLGQTLNFTVVVRVEPDEALAAECVSAEVLSGENRLPPALLRVAVEPGPSASERLVRVTSGVNIDEPVVTVTLTLGCAQGISRKFVAFIDPPSVSLPQSSIVESRPAEAPRVQAAASAPDAAAAPPAATTAAAAAAPPAVAASAPSKTAQVRRPRAVAAPAQGLAAAPATAPRPRSADAAPRQPRPAPSPTGSRLQLEAAAPVRGRAASEPGSAEATLAAVQRVDATVSLLTEQSEIIARERARLVALEENLTRLRNESQATQASLASLQARLKEAETQRYANPLVFVLAWVVALLSVAVAVLVWRQRKARRTPQWWAQQAPAPVTQTPNEVAITRPPAAPAPLAPPRAPATAARLIDTSKPMWAESRLTEAPPDMVPEPRRDLSVEELIDLEQQAEFFVVLGQDEAAIDLLMGHVRNTGGISPLPYLKLLEIYKRRGDRSAYERIRERFNRRFNAYAPDWDADLQHGKSLEDYPETMLKLEGLWGTPQRVMETLDALLFRRDEAAQAYDLPAYRELLFLYSVARDFTTRGSPETLESTAVDLLLPLDEPPTLTLQETAAAPSSRLVDLDMTSPIPAEFEPTRRPRAEPVTSSANLNSDFLDLPELPTGPGRLDPRR